MAVEDSSKPYASEVETTRFPIVGIGASAGGLVAFKQLLQALPTDLGMAFVLIPHLAPEHRSLMAEILSRETPMPVLEVHDEPLIEHNKVYVIPPNRTMLLANGHLKLVPREELQGQHRSIDAFFRSLAEDQSNRAIGIILSGTGNDGTLGAEAIKAGGGITFAQDESAQQDSMPRSAIASGCVDFVFAPEEMATELARIANHPYLVTTSPAQEALSAQTGSENDSRKILGLLYDNTGIDFSGYKSTTLYRRMMRRMLLRRLEKPSEYVRLLETDSGELQSLCRDLLISVTAFFRDPACFDTLKREILPEILRERARGEPIRIWVIGCATGEEAYSLAITLAELASEEGRDIPAQIFATDLNDNGVIKARIGLYSKNIVEDVSPERLRRFFVEVDGGYQVTKQIREMCVFARQNILTDPPFSHLDLVSCRNLLIYMQPILQKRLLPLLHYSLKPDGFLWLGSSESISGFGELFETIEPKQKIFKRRPGVTPVSISFVTTGPRSREFPRAFVPSSEVRFPDVQREADKLVAMKYAPPGVILNADLEVQQFRGDTSRYLVMPGGKPTTNILKMAREGLLVPLRAALEKARVEGAQIRQEDVRIRSEGGMRSVDIEVLPLGNTGPERSFLVLFEDRESKDALAVSASVSNGFAASEDELARVTQELAATREYMQSLIEQQEASNEELQSANEEIQSSNEELQSVNEELQTSKEEVQSSNEELSTVNEELRHRNESLDRAHNDLNNFIASSQLPMVMVSTDLRIRRFSPAAERLLNLINADIGRSVVDFRFALELPDLERLLIDSIHELVPKEREVQDRVGNWYSLRIRPYRTTENKIDGAIFVLVDIEAQKKAQEEIRAGEEKYRLLIEGATGIGIILLNTEGKVSAWNVGAQRILGYNETQIVGQHFSHFFVADNAASQSALLEGAQSQTEIGTTDDLQLLRLNGTRFWASVVATSLLDNTGTLRGFALVVRDITDRKKADELRDEEDRRKDEFLATLAHELRNPLAPLANTLETLRSLKNNPSVIDRGLERMDRQIATLKRLVSDVLDISRINAGHIELQRELLDLRSVVGHAIETEQDEIAAGHHELSTHLPETPVWIYGDAIRLEQIIANLLSNAAKYTDPHGQIVVTLDISNTQKADAVQEAVLRVRDSGIGIPTEQLEQIFKFFARTDAARVRNNGGLGVGLSLVRGLVELHGGTVEASSSGIGKGSEFTVRLPLKSGAAGPKETAPQRTSIAGQANPSGRRVLVVDDNEDAAQALAELIHSFGCDVQVAFNGTKALETAISFRPDLIFLDVRMPEIDGFEVAKHLRAQREFDATIMVALTGYGTDRDRQRSLAAGFNAHLVKPIDSKALAEILATTGSAR